VVYLPQPHCFDSYQAFTKHLLSFSQLAPRLHQYLNMLRFRGPAVISEPAPFQGFRIRRLQTRSAQKGEIAPNLHKLFWRIGLLGREVGPLRHLFARIAQ
jgi:hypothetical protein